MFDGQTETVSEVYFGSLLQNLSHHSSHNQLHPFIRRYATDFVPFTSIQSDVGPVKHSKCPHGIQHGSHNKYSIMLARANVL